MNATDLRADILKHLEFSLGKDLAHATLYDIRMALTLAVRDRVVTPWFAATRATYAAKSKRVYYLSMEFLIGRLLEDAIHNLGLMQAAQEAMTSLDADFAAVLADEPDAALGNGGLGRLAACFLDSMSTLGCPGYGYGIRYEHGLFRQSFHEGRQVEEAENWLRQRHGWEFERPEAAFQIGFGGSVSEAGKTALWTPGEAVIAKAYDTPTIGWQGKWANTLRLWGAEPVRAFDLAAFNQGDYAGAAGLEAAARTISRVLYPDDTTDTGKELRLKQEFFFTAASLRDIVRRFQAEHSDLRALPTKAAIQLNDTHPAIAGPELVRILHDENDMPLDEAILTARATLSYTNHTLLPEALERWPEALMARVLPRHMQLIERIEDTHRSAYPKSAVRIVEGGDVKMGELSFIMGHKVNGVSALHSDLVKTTVFAELHALHPDRIINQTNGVTPRRWMLGANPRLSALITDTISSGWVADLERLRELEPHVADAGFMAAFADAKRANKVELSNWFGHEHGQSVDPDAMYDVQIKRFHEYKRQHLNILETIALWTEMRDNPNAGWTPRVKIFGGKAAPGYVMAKEIIHLINDVATVINADPVTSQWLKVVYPPNYNVSMAEKLIPAADLSEQISTAGKEASGTGNMKFALNGALTIGTLDGANVEIREQVGAENFFLFGMTAPEVVACRENPEHQADAIKASPRLKAALKLIEKGIFSDGDDKRYKAILKNLRKHDYFTVCADFDSYYDCQRQVDAAYRDADQWMRMAALNTARSGWFSSDRTILGYMADVWDIKPMI
ncbi:glycogen/starch/alpha-glucan phosphorylase [Roseicitreum antarcticum]|uniref:Alpha-1,4 glucan phosphorylase n=1 Tax=Roseicitreum antarcticum TaxID=564137 RepID=A0A1H2XP08_9RHOB|nr:glycogen/starch/alpha-glucan phosphorylase [Roseicitreum antarcticum]SDW94597.1 starch phosphorylase [Roseicitreum antarcticum]